MKKKNKNKNKKILSCDCGYMSERFLRRIPDDGRWAMGDGRWAMSVDPVILSGLNIII
jgi:hypothetical protein